MSVGAALVSGGAVLLGIALLILWVRRGGAPPGAVRVVVRAPPLEGGVTGDEATEEVEAIEGARDDAAAAVVVEEGDLEGLVDGDDDEPDRDVLNALGGG